MRKSLEFTGMPKSPRNLQHCLPVANTLQGLAFIQRGAVLRAIGRGARSHEALRR